MPKIFSLLLVPILLCSFHSETENRVFEEYYKKNLLTQGELIDGLKTGKWQFFYPNGKLHFMGNFNSNHMHQEWEFFHSNGQMQSKAQFENGLLHGSFLTYDTKGALTYLKEFEQGKESGKEEWFSENQLHCRITKVAGGRKIEKFYSNGSVKSVCIEWHGKQNDTAKVYYANGVQKEELVFYKNLLIKAGTSLNMQGETLNRGDFNQGEGLLIRYYDNGQPRSRVYYKNGLKQGIAHFYFDDGTLNMAGLYNKGYKNGIWKIYNSKGDLESEKEFRNSDIDNEFAQEFSWNKVGKGYAAVAEFPNGEKALQKYLKDVITNKINNNKAEVYFFAKLDAFGYISSYELDLIENGNTTQLNDFVLADFPRCIPAFIDGLPTIGEVATRFKL